MNSRYLESAVDAMRERGIDFDIGLTDEEIDAAESAHGFQFPPDLRTFVAHALPLGERFPDWRHPHSTFIEGRLTWPADGICFDIEHNSFWLSEWGDKPDVLEDANSIARAAIRRAPFLIPIFGHRYIPATPCESGNPIFSVYQADIICYGDDLTAYLFAEFGVPNPFATPASPREIQLWSELVRLNNE